MLRPAAIREGYCHVGLNRCLCGLCMSHGPDMNARTQRFPAEHGDYFTPFICQFFNALAEKFVRLSGT